MPEGTSPPSGGELVLYVTADDAQGEAFSHGIQAHTDFNVLTTSTVDTALDILDSRNDVACIVSDYELSDVDGLAFLQSVRAQFTDIPFILFTSEGNETVASKAIAARVTDYLIQERVQDQWTELASLIERSIRYHQPPESLDDLEHRGKIILEASPDPIAVVQDGSFVYANTHALALVEVGRIEELSGRTIADIVSDESLQSATDTLATIRTGDTNVDRLEASIVGQQGTKTPVELTTVSIAWHGTQAILLICRDISDRKERKSKLRRFSQAVEAAGHAIYVTDSDGTIEYANPAFEDITGYSATEAIGRNPDILRSGEMPEEHYERLWDTISAGEVWEATLVNRRKNGELYHAHQTISPITDRDGSVQAYVAVQTDITEEIRLQEKLTESKERYESLFNSIRDAILVGDIEQRITNCNSAFTELFGYELAEIEGKHVKFVFESEEEYKAMAQEIESHVDDPTFTHTGTYEKKSGQTFPGETSLFYLRNSDDEIVGLVGVIRDVSGQQDRLTQLQIIDRVLQHNFNNDINIIQGFADRIVAEGTPPLTTYAETISETGQDLLETVEKERQITDFLSDPPSTEKIDISRICDHASERVTATYPQASITTKYAGETELDGTVALEQAIVELLTNSIIHAESESPRITLRVNAPADTVTIKVIDENPRIPEMERKVLTGEEENSPVYHGSGMGLWLVQLIVNHANGTLEIGANDPKGNIVTIRLPVY